MYYKTSSTVPFLFFVAACSFLFGCAEPSQLDESAEPPIKEQTVSAKQLPSPPSTNVFASGYQWTTDHMHIGVRWQPFGGRPKNSAYDASRPVIAEDSSYAQFWVSWNALEPTLSHTNYLENPSSYLQTIETAVDECVARGLKTELVIWHCPPWATVSGKAGPFKPREGLYAEFATRLARHFKGRVHAYQMYHEANVASMMEDGDIDLLISEMFIKGAQAVRAVYNEEPMEPVVISTSGASPCDACPVLDGLEGKGGVAASDYYDRLISNPEVMASVDALNINVSDHFSGYGKMDGSIIASVWGNYDLVRTKLDAAGYFDKKILASESWIVWDAAGNANDVNADGVKNELDAYSKTLTILGRCLERGLNTANLPWSDNSSTWAMGLTKRVDYNGRIKQLQPDIVIPASDGGADVVTKKVLIQGGDDDFSVIISTNSPFTVENYSNPSDPNHLHYYIWKWYAQLAGGTNEVIRHALAGEVGNDIIAWGIGFTGNETYKLSSYDRTQDRFTVLLYASGANGKLWEKVSIPATIQNGKSYNNDFSQIDFRGEGFEEGAEYHVNVETKDIDQTNGSDIKLSIQKPPAAKVENGMLTVTVGGINKFTKIEFVRGPRK